MSKTQYDRVWNYIESGKSEGAKVALGGEKRSTNGYWVDPTSKSLSSVFVSLPLRYTKPVFTDVKPTMKIVKEEVSCIVYESTGHGGRVLNFRVDLRAGPRSC